MKRNTIGWQICCQWKDGSTSWENLFDLKESHPLETAEYAMTIGIDHEPAFDSEYLMLSRSATGLYPLSGKRMTRHLKRTTSLALKCLRLSKRPSN